MPGDTTAACGTGLTALPRESVVRALESCGAVLRDDGSTVFLKHPGDPTVLGVHELGSSVPRYIAMRLANKFGAEPHLMFQ